MSESNLIGEEPEFEIQMKSLAEEAEHLIEDRVPVEAASSQAEPVKRKAAPSFLDMLKPLVLGIEALGRATTENTLALSRIEEAAVPQASLPQLMTGLQENLDQKNRLNQKMFDTLHEELRSYKDGFLLEIFHKPIVRDLVTLFDDLSALHKHTTVSLQAADAATAEPLRNLNTNLDHIVHSVLEILARMEVQRLEPSTGKLDKQRHRAVSVELADAREDDQNIASSVKPGFVWRDRLLRPEEVIVKKWKEGFLVALTPRLRNEPNTPSGT